MTRFSDAYSHPRFKSAENTDPAAVFAFKRKNPGFVCETWNIWLTEAACKKRRTLALEVKQVVTCANIKIPTEAWAKLEPCRKCKSYPRKDRGNR
jgi:hypothetical protein